LRAKERWSAIMQVECCVEGDKNVECDGGVRNMCGLRKEEDIY
jgi:hypothetical protein